MSFNVIRDQLESFNDEVLIKTRGVELARLRVLQSDKRTVDVVTERWRQQASLDIFVVNNIICSRSSTVIKLPYRYSPSNTPRGRLSPEPPPG